MDSEFVMRRRRVADDATKEQIARENHCEIERRRRVKMTSLFNDLCETVPACSKLTRKPDKLTILRMATQHVQRVKARCVDFINELQLQVITNRVTGGFMILIDCDTGAVLYNSRPDILQYDAQMPLMKTVYELIHVDDVEMVRQFMTNRKDPIIKVDLRCGTAKLLELKENDDHGVAVLFPCRWRVREADNYFMVTQMQGVFLDKDVFIGSEGGESSPSRKVFSGIARFVPVRNIWCAPNPEGYMRHDVFGSVIFVCDMIEEMMGIRKMDIMRMRISDFCVKSDAIKLINALGYAINCDSEQTVNFCRFRFGNGPIIAFDCKYNVVRNPFNGEIHYVVGIYSRSKTFFDPVQNEAFEFVQSNNWIPEPPPPTIQQQIKFDTSVPATTNNDTVLPTHCDCPACVVSLEMNIPDFYAQPIMLPAELNEQNYEHRTNDFDPSELMDFNNTYRQLIVCMLADYQQTIGEDFYK